MAHRGGTRTAVGSPEYQLLRNWIAAGGPQDEPDDSRVTRLRVQPARADWLGRAKPYRLRVEADFADGTTEDVTRLCSFESRDPAVAAVDRDGWVTAHGVGEAALHRPLPRRAGAGDAGGPAAGGRGLSRREAQQLHRPPRSGQAAPAQRPARGPRATTPPSSAGPPWT